MLEISSILLMSIVLLSLTIVLIVLFLKHINIMYLFIEEMRKAQTSIHSDIVEIKLNLARIISERLRYAEDKEEIVAKTTKENNNSGIIKIPKIKADTLPNNEKSQKQIQLKSLNNNSNLKSFQVSEEELLEMIGDKELVFKKQINVTPGEMFIEANINIDDKK